MKASHYFNMLDARGVISVTERAAYMGGCGRWHAVVVRPGLGQMRRCRMADLLIELVSEEIPARMQNMAAQHFATAVRTALDDLGVWTNDAGIDGLCGPRHLAVYASGIAVAQPDRVIEKRGPRVDAPEAAIADLLHLPGSARGAD